MLATLLIIAADLPAEAALLPLPREMRATASIVSFDKEDGPTVIRQGSGTMVCRRIRHDGSVFDARCYHRDFMPAVFHAWVLSRSIKDDERRRTQLDDDFQSGRVPLIRQPTAGYRMGGPIGDLDPVTEKHGPRMARWQSIHFPYRSAGELGLPETRKGLMPYVMASGSWWSHVMINDDGTAD